MLAGALKPSESLAKEYSGNAGDYARLWSPVIAPMAHPILSALPVGLARTILDVGAGTGAMFPELQRMAPDALVAGSDRAEGMLRVARAKGWTTVSVADAQLLPTRSSAVDVGLLVFVLFHIPDPIQALREMSRVLQPHGRAGIVVWGPDPGVPGAAIWTEELDNQDAPPDPRDPSVTLIDRMNTPEKLSSLIDSSGLKIEKLWGQLFCHSFTLDTVVRLQLGCGVASRRLRGVSAEAKAACEQRVRDRLRSFSDAELEYRPEVLYAVVSKQ